MNLSDPAATILTLPRLRLGKKELESIYDSVVNPFYNRIQNDNNTVKFIDPQRLPALKIKQTRFIFRFFTSDIGRLQRHLTALNRAHMELGIDVETLTVYFFVWSNAITTWLKENRTLDTVGLQAWQNKIYILFGSILHGYIEPIKSMPESETAAKISDQTKLAEKVQEIHEAQVNKQISAEAFLDGIEFDHDLIDELEELEQDAISNLYAPEKVDEDHLREVAAILSKYARMLENTYEFKELAFALDSLRMVLEQFDQSVSSSKQLSKILLFLNGILSDIGNWRKEVFIARSAIDVHYLDASLFSSIAQLEILLTNIEEKDPETEDPNYLELF